MLISSLQSSVQREVYGHRVADMAKISYEAMKLEVDKAFKRRIYRDKKQQEKKDLAPAQALQPKNRNIRYDNVKSAVAEENVLAMILREPALLEEAKTLEESQFSSPLLGKVYGQLCRRYRAGLEVSAAVLEDLTPEESSHVAGIVHRQQGPVNAQALLDCIRTIQAEHQTGQVRSGDDLLAMRERLQQRKGYQV